MKPSRTYTYFFLDRERRVIASLDYQGDQIPVEAIKLLLPYIPGGETVEQWKTERVKP